ncbi:hypothetical protein ACOMHN_049436 [Nucella lapillus]
MIDREMDNRWERANSAIGTLYKQHCFRTILKIHCSDSISIVEALEQAEINTFEAVKDTSTLARACLKKGGN